MSIYHQNLKILSLRFPEIIGVLNEVDTSGFLVQSALKSGLTLSSPDGLTLHSRIDPIREAENFVQSKGMSNGGRWLVFGFGLGYHLHAALSTPGKIDELISVELCPEVIRIALEKVDLTVLLAHKGFQLWLPGGIPSLEQRIVNLPSDFRIAVHPPSLTLWRRRNLPLVDILDRMELQRINECYSHSAYQKAVESNQKYLNVCPDVNSYFGTFENRPMVVVGAGPSLDEAKPLLKKYRSSLFLLAVNAAFIPLRNAGIRPDAVVCVEPRSAAQSSFDGQGEEQIPLIFVPGTNHQVVENWHGPRLLAYGTSGKPSPHTGTVAGTALDVAIRLGGNPIVLTGLDLALSEQWYAQGVEKPHEEKVGKMMVAHHDTLENSFVETFPVPGVNGQMVSTTRAFRYFIQSLECLIEDAKSKHPTLKIFDLKRRGALITGTKPMIPNRESLEIILNTNITMKYPPSADWRIITNGAHP